MGRESGGGSPEARRHVGGGHVCPWWLGWALACPLRALFQPPEGILSPLVRSGDRVLEVGPGMGFFTLPLARLVGDAGRVVAVDLQERMLRGLERRARRAGLSDRIVSRPCTTRSLGLGEEERFDFALLYAVVHEVSEPAGLLAEVRAALMPMGSALLAEPRMHVTAEAFARTLALAEGAGFRVVGTPSVRYSRAAVLER